MQANVGRGGAANDLALALAFEKDIDILLLQEPWIGADLGRQMSKNILLIKRMLHKKNGMSGPK